MSRNQIPKPRPPSDWPDDHADDGSGSEQSSEEIIGKEIASPVFKEVVPQDRYYPRESSYSHFEYESRLNRFSMADSHLEEYDIYSTLKNPRQSDSRYASCAPSSESLLAMINSKRPHLPTNNIISAGNSWDTDEANIPLGPSITKDYPWPAWTEDNQIPITKEEIWSIFEQLSIKFGFQTSSIQNQFDSLMTMLDSRASRMLAPMALLTLHADYIGGVNANYRTWFFANQLYNEPTEDYDVSISLEEWWRIKMYKLTPSERITQIALYLCIWGEALNVRYLPEMICFIFKLAHDSCFEQTVPEGDYLDRVVTPIYNFIRDQNYEIINGQFLKRELDHAQVIGYDDINETFWCKENIHRLILNDNSTLLMSIHPKERYTKLGEVNWKLSIEKTYHERRTWLHVLTNFSRVWIFHLSFFFIFWILNSQFLFTSLKNFKENRVKGLETKDIEDLYLPIVLSLIGASGGIAAGIAAAGTFCEFFFVEKDKRKYKILFRRYVILVCLMIINIAPSAIIFIFSKSTASGQKIARRDDWKTLKPVNMSLKSTGINKPSEIIYSREPLWYAIAIINMLIGISTVIFLIITPPAHLFVKLPPLCLKTSSLPGLINRAFTANYAPLNQKDRITSISMWALIILFKLVESYVALIWSFKSAFRILVYLEMSSIYKEAFHERLGQIIIPIHRHITMGFMVLLLLIMFILDTYLWYIIVTSLFSVANAFQMGISVLSPWKNIFGMMPKRIYTKVLATSNTEIKLRPKILCSQIWNSIVISMYRDHLISIDHVQKLLYQQVEGEFEGRKKIKPPTFFVAQEDTGLNEEFYPPGSEAERRISFFASSLSTVVPVPLPVENMPTFTVFTPHYSEKILLSLREIIREDDQYTRVTLLEYLKSLYAVEWEHFVKDTKILAEENALLEEGAPNFNLMDEEKTEAKIREEDLPFYCVGFKSASPEFTLRTRIWASLRTQTLYRTITGFMNYSKAIKFLHRIENPELVKILSGNSEALESELDLMVRRKFNFLVSMQRYTKFNKDERDNVEFLFNNYPDLQVAYLEEITNEDESSTVYSCLIDGHCELDELNRRIPRYRIRIPGNPILGDGKSDNQNHAVIFTRGEYIQVIDANQDNYLEEAYKIRSILAEFEEYYPPRISPYMPRSIYDHVKKPVAILGAREYIFSENIGILGDIAAGKESTFGTLTHRILSKVGGRLHYGHPDFLNMIFMNTRGGLSKAQKGLHLNEDIFAGMNAFQRGGRIKHTEYIQCGKGRDLGFCSVLNFTTKIGTGMGEQLLSREYYYIYTQLSLDRMLTLFYAHPGFHVNNIMIMFSIKIFMVVLVLVGVLISTQNTCNFELIKDELPSTSDCIAFMGVLSWIDRTVFSVFVVIFVTFLPLTLQVLSEQGVIRTLSRLGKQLASGAPLLEIFTTQIYSYSILSNMSFGGARYIGTGRGFATTRQPFSVLYSRFCSSSIYSGMQNSLLLLFACITMFRFSYLYFWFTVIGLTLSPWLFNPHQFSFYEFILDYRSFIRWMSRGNTNSVKDSWIAHCRYTRTRITGQKRKHLGDKETKLGGHIPRAHKLTIFVNEIIIPLFSTVVMLIAYTTLSAYNPQTMISEYSKIQYSVYYNNLTTSYKDLSKSSGLFKSLIVGLGPVVLNMGILLIFFFISILLGPIVSLCTKSFGSFIAGLARGLAVIFLIASVWFLYMLENFDLARTTMGVIAGMCLQRFIFSIFIIAFLTREFGHNNVNCAWWSGRWTTAKLGWLTLTQPAREFLCKIIELSLFSSDFIMAHLIFLCLFPFTLIPQMDRLHSTMLFWLSPSRQFRPPIFSLRQRVIRRYRTIRYTLLLVGFLTLLLSLFLIPLFLKEKLLSIVSREKVPFLPKLYI